MTIRLRELDNRERVEILRYMHDENQDPAFRQRLKIVWFAHQGWSSPQMKSMVDLHPATIRKWIRKFNEKGVLGLQVRRGGGAPARISLGQKAEIIRVASREPGEIGLSFKRWSLPKIRDYLRREGIVDEVSTEWIRKILRSAGITLSRSRVVTPAASQPAAAAAAGASTAPVQTPTPLERPLVVERKARPTIASKRVEPSTQSD